MTREFIMLPVPAEHYDAVVKFLADGCPLPQERPHRRDRKGRKRTLSDEEIDEMRALRLSGLSLAKIGDRFDTSPSTVLTYTRDIPSPIPARNPNHRSSGLAVG